MASNWAVRYWAVRYCCGATDVLTLSRRQGCAVMVFDAIVFSPVHIVVAPLIAFGVVRLAHSGLVKVLAVTLGVLLPPLFVLVFVGSARGIDAAEPHPGATDSPVDLWLGVSAGTGLAVLLGLFVATLWQQWRARPDHGAG